MIRMQEHMMCKGISESNGKDRNILDEAERNES